MDYTHIICLYFKRPGKVSTQEGSRTLFDSIGLGGVAKRQPSGCALIPMSTHIPLSEAFITVGNERLSAHFESNLVNMLSHETIK